MTYRRLPDGETSDITQGRSYVDAEGVMADELNAFRRKVYADNDQLNEVPAS